MIPLLKELIVDSQVNPLFTGVARHLKVRSVAKKATVVIGVRRCGKSTFMNQITAELKSKGVSQENILHLNFFDDRLSTIKSVGLDLVLEAYYQIYPEKKNQEKIYCFFDEIQVIPGWESFIERTLRLENCEVYITGSSADLLSKEIATQMRGRALTWELFPFLFKEYLTFFKIKTGKTFTSQERLKILKTFESYWIQGGFPEVFKQDNLLRIKIHQEYFNSILYRDLIERYDISHPKALKDLAIKLINNISSLYTINSLTNYLQSLGHKVPKNSVSQYVAWFEDSFFLFTIRIFNASISKSNANPKKIYCIDHALVRSISSGILLNSGHLLENLVFVELRSQYEEIYYYKTKRNQEVDFLVIKPNRDKMLIQVCESLANIKTRQREISALQNAMEELGLHKAILVTRSDQEELKFEQGIIEIIPVWSFLLQK
jgi:predicted AAA+ superfamily ATPase